VVIAQMGGVKSSMPWPKEKKQREAFTHILRDKRLLDLFNLPVTE
jgi:hypothetical protein